MTAMVLDDQDKEGSVHKSSLKLSTLIEYFFLYIQKNSQLEEIESRDRFSNCYRNSS